MLACSCSPNFCVARKLARQIFYFCSCSQKNRSARHARECSQRPFVTPNSTWHTAPKISICVFSPIYVNMEQRSGSLKVGNSSENPMEPFLNEKMDSVSQSSRKHSGTRLTLSSRASTSSSAARRKALAEVAAARQKAEYDRLLAEKERERIEMEAEEERKRRSQRARFECDKAVLRANRKLAIAETKLKAIEQSIEEEDGKATMVTIPGLDNPIDTKEITRAWINAQETMETLDRTGYPSPPSRLGKGITHQTSKRTNECSLVCRRRAFTRHKCCQLGKVTAREQSYRKHAPFRPARNKSLRVDSHR